MKILFLSKEESLKFETKRVPSLAMIQSFLATIAVATLPLVEQRLAIPFGFFSQHLSIWNALLAGIIGNVVSVGIVLWLWPIVARFAAKHSPICDRFLQRLFARTRKKHSHQFTTWGSIFLIFFVMLPIPGSGGWSGSLVAWLFGVPYWRAMKLIFIGLILGAFLVAGMTVGIDESLQILNEFVSEASL